MLVGIMMRYRNILYLRAGMYSLALGKVDDVMVEQLLCKKEDRGSL